MWYACMYVYMYTYAASFLTLSSNVAIYFVFNQTNFFTTIVWAIAFLNFKILFRYYSNFVIINVVKNEIYYINLIVCVLCILILL
jgi:hypothetical protein